MPNPANKKSTFEAWKRQVDLNLVILVGMGADDLPDVDYYTWFAAGLTPRNAAAKAIRYAVES